MSKKCETFADADILPIPNVNIEKNNALKSPIGIRFCGNKMRNTFSLNDSVKGDQHKNFIVLFVASVLDLGQEFFRFDTLD